MVRQSGLLPFPQSAGKVGRTEKGKGGIAIQTSGGWAKERSKESGGVRCYVSYLSHYMVSVCSWTACSLIDTQRKSMVNIIRA